MSPTYSPPSKTVADLLSEVQRTFGDESGIVLEQNDIIRWANLACDEIVSRNQVLQAKADMQTVDGVGDYPVQQLGISEIDSVHLDAKILDYVSFQQAEQIIFDGTNSTDLGTSEIWYMRENVLTIWPAPQGTHTLTIYFSKKPERVTNTPQQLLPLPDRFYGRIVEYVLKNAHEMVQNWEAAQAKQTQFDTALSRMGQAEKDAGNELYPFITVMDEDW